MAHYHEINDVLTSLTGHLYHAIDAIRVFTVSKVEKNIYMSDVQVYIEIYSKFSCVQVLCSPKTILSYSADCKALREL